MLQIYPVECRLDPSFPNNLFPTLSYLKHLKQSQVAEDYSAAAASQPSNLASL